VKNEPVSFVAKSLKRIDLGSVPRRNVARNQGDTDQQQSDGREDHRIGRAYFEEQILHDAGQRQRRRQPQRHSYQCQAHSPPDQHPQHIYRLRAQ